ncbi:MAG: PAS domain S-box protein [Actinobacteria bacterium]|nr:PAS domain S-box protein [Actinomycetota bacterium]MDI6831217.1 PAS domain S-box protein [Actinomycetota bacterium]
MIRILHVEDNQDHALLIRRGLAMQDPELEVLGAASAEEALRIMAEEHIDLVLSDYALGGGMDGLALLREVRRRDPAIPFIFLTGQGNEEVASHALHEGANDYFIKRSGSLQFKRMAMTLRKQWEAHRAQRGWEEAEGRYRHLVEHMNAGLALARGDRFVYVNPKLCEILGYDEEELTSRPFLDFASPASRDIIAERYRRRRAGESIPETYDIWVRRRDGREITLELTASVIEDSQGIATLAVMRDVTREREAEEFFRLVFEHANEAIILSELDGRILEANPAASRLTGYSLEELRSMYVQDLHVPEERQLSESELEKLRRGEFEGFVGTGRCKDGTLKRCAVTGTPVDLGERRLMLGLVTELPGQGESEVDKRIAEEADTRFKLAIDQAPLVAVQGYDAEGRVTYWNRASEELYGFSRQEALGKTLDQLILDQEGASEFRALLSEVWRESRPSSPREWHTRDRAGNVRWVLSTLFPLVVEGRSVEAFCMDIDITPRMELEAELRRRNVELETFAHTLSHELRAPLTSMGGYLHLLRESAAGKLDAEEAECLDRCSAACENMERLIGSLLDLARRDLGGRGEESVDLEAMTRELWEELLPSFPGLHPRLEMSFRVREAFADPELLRRCMANLLDNALKHHLGPHDPSVEAGSMRGDGETVVFVRDDGPGIPPELQEELFLPYRRGSTPAPGLGIGLAMSARAVESWGGRLWVESEPGKGTTFFFTIPAASR